MNEFLERVAVKEIKVLYVDDQRNDIGVFRSKVEIFNDADVDDGDTKQFIILSTAEDSLQAMKILEQNEIDVLICDQNMPNQKGIEFIGFLKGEYRDLLYVLYTGAAAGVAPLKEKCKEMDVLFFAKAESFSTLINRIANKMKKNKIDPAPKPPTHTPMETGRSLEKELYAMVLTAIINDMNNLIEQDASFVFQYGLDMYSAKDIKEAVENGTDFGKEYMKSYVAGSIILNKLT